MKKLKYLIILIVLIITIVIVSLLLIKKNEPVQENKNTIQETVVTDKFTEVKNEENIFNVVNCINKYFDTINQNNSSFYGRDENGNQVKTVEESQIQQMIYNILAQNYIEENNIIKENVYENIPELKEKVIFVPLEMKVKTEGNIQKYIVKGIIENLNYEFISNIYITVNVDTEKQTFSIEPTNNESEDLEELEKEIKIKTIEENENNKIIKEEVNDQYVCTQLLYFYKRLALASPEIAYSLMDDEYKEKRYENVENFKLYVENQKDQIKGLTLNKFLINEERTQFVCQDKNENYYIFETNGNLLNYKYKLDTYTILSEENQELYENATEKEKVSLNTEKFVKMINSKDYHTIYNLLDEEYKTIHFPTEQDFINYIKYYIPEYYTYKSSIIDKQSDIYIQELELYNKKDSSEIAFEMKLMMQIGEGTEFKISLTLENI